MNAVRFSLVALAVLAAAPMLAAPAAAQRSSLPCVSTRIAKVVMPSGPARYQGGRLTLENGAVLELRGAQKRGHVPGLGDASGRPGRGVLWSIDDVRGCRTVAHDHRAGSAQRPILRHARRYVVGAQRERFEHSGASHDALTGVQLG